MIQGRILLCAASAAAARQRPPSANGPASQLQPQPDGTPSSSSFSSSSGTRTDAFPPVTINFRSFGAETPHAQREALRMLIRGHEAAVERNNARRDSRYSTYDEDRCALFPFYHLASLPPTTGGAHRSRVRVALTADNGPLTVLEEELLQPWRKAGERAVVVFGAKSVPYLRRQLAMDDTHTFLVVDHSLKAVANAAAALVKDYGPRVHFLRADAMFTGLSVLSRDSVDAVVVPMPAPFWSEKGSYRRLVTSDFICAAHRVLRARTDAADPRGLVTFTDCEPYADFIVEQLTEAKLMVPWTRKNPQDIYSRWLPVSPSGRSDGDTSASLHPKEFAQQRFREVVAVAASKSGAASDQALSFIEGYDYKRKYFRAFNDGSR